MSLCCGVVASSARVRDHVLAGVLVVACCAGPEERVLGCRVGDDLVVDVGLSRRIADSRTLGGVDERVVLADQVQQPAAHARGELQGGRGPAERDVGRGQPPAVEHGHAGDRQPTRSRIRQMATGAEADHRDPVDARLGA